MNAKKYFRDNLTLYEVTFISGENDNFIDEKPTTHTATVIFSGYWFHCISIDGKQANSLSYRSPKTAAKNAYLVK